MCTVLVAPGCFFFYLLSLACCTMSTWAGDTALRFPQIGSMQIPSCISSLILPPWRQTSACRLAARLASNLYIHSSCLDVQSNGKRCCLGAGKWSVGRGHGSSLRLGLSEPQMQYIMPRSLGGFRNCQADDSQPEHARGCVRPRRHSSYRLPSRHGPWAVMSSVVTDGHLQ